MALKTSLSTIFDKVAEKYYSCIPVFPKKYLTLISNTFQISKNSHVLDLGCGAGYMTLAFTQYSSYVEGLDISKTMISMAKNNDVNKKVTWIYTAAEKFNFDTENYDLIFAFELFHLFSNKKNVLKKIITSLKPGGSLCIAWAVYDWEKKCKKIIQEIFAKYNLHWDDSWQDTSVTLFN